MKFGVLLLIFSTLGIFAKDVTKIHDWVSKNIQSLEKYIQETDMTSDILLGVQRNDKGKNFQNWIFSTNHKQHIELTDGQIKKTTAFGPDSEYFTETTQNFVFLGTQIKDKEWIKIQMKKGNEDTQRIDTVVQIGSIYFHVAQKIAKIIMFSSINLSYLNFQIYLNYYFIRN